MNGTHELDLTQTVHLALIKVKLQTFANSCSFPCSTAPQLSAARFNLVVSLIESYRNGLNWVCMDAGHWPLSAHHPVSVSKKTGLLREPCIRVGCCLLYAKWIMWWEVMCRSVDRDIVCTPDVHDTTLVAAVTQPHVPGLFIDACKDIIRNIRIQLEHRHPVITSWIINFKYTMAIWVDSWREQE